MYCDGERNPITVHPRVFQEVGIINGRDIPGKTPELTSCINIYLQGILNGTEQ